MRKLAILAAALTPLLGGCVASVCDVPTVTIHWQLQDANGAGWSCYTAGVSWVDVYVGGGRGVRFPCSDGVGVVDVSGLAPGAYPTTVEGIASDGKTIYDRALAFDVTVADCGNAVYYPVLGEGTLEIDYHFAPTDACHGGYMWFALRDETAGADISIIDGNSTPYWQTYYGCYSVGGGTALRFPVPFGPYTLRGIQEVANPTTAPVSLYEMCSPSGLSVLAPGLNVFTPPSLTATAPGAPACF